MLVYLVWCFLGGAERRPVPESQWEVLPETLAARSHDWDECVMLYVCENIYMRFAVGGELWRVELYL